MGLHAVQLPAGVVSVRSTPRFTAETAPAGLLAAHRLAAGVLGVLHVEASAVLFVDEQTQERRRVPAGEQQVIRPEAAHHVEPEASSAFRVEMFR